MTPTIGRIVCIDIGNDQALASNGAEIAPAIITRVWSETCINVTVFPDNGIPVTRTSVTRRTEADRDRLDRGARWFDPRELS